MMKVNKTLALLLSLVLLLGSFSAALAADEAVPADAQPVTPISEATGTEADDPEETPDSSPSPFGDVAEDAWYFDSVVTAYALGLMKGVTNIAFDPDGSVTLAQAVTMAARIHSLYATGEENFDQSEGDHWFDTYVSYCKENGILTEDYADYDANATRAQFAEIFAAALPEEALEVINTITDGAIPDIDAEAPYANAVYTLYRAGVLTGDTGTGAFRPADGISRAEAAAIVTRMMDDTLRREVTLG